MFPVHSEAVPQIQEIGGRLEKVVQLSPVATSPSEGGPSTVDALVAPPAHPAPEGFGFRVEGLGHPTPGRFST